MKFKKPNFWDYNKPNFIAYILLPITYLIKIYNFLRSGEKVKSSKIKTICIGNIYVGGTGKTPTSIKISKILNNLNVKNAFIKKKYHNQIDEQIILSSHGKLFCKKNRLDSLKEALNENFEVAVFDDGLQDRRINYHIAFVCFNINSWIGNGFCLPSGPLRENLKSLKKYDAVFLNGNGEDTVSIEKIIKNINPNIKVFTSLYVALNVNQIDIDKNYLSFSGIGNPDSFLKTLKDNNIKIVKNLIFPDHYNFTDKDIINIKETAKNLNAKIITTEKDYNRLNQENSKDVECLKVGLKVLNEKELIDFLNNKL